ncbi:MAG: hypothetical protein PHS80_10135 [Methanothrix sp.]|nr:hypothetical protein [Methanothrix sp.]MDD4447487.1 hypothetical protein [Methanothrix sp.]
MRMLIRRQTILSLVVLMMLSTSLVDAFSFDMPTTQKYVDTYNKQINNVPTVLKSMVGSEKVNIIVTRENGSEFRVGMDIVSGRIERTVEGGISDPSIIVTTTQSALNEVVKSKDRITAFKKQADAGQIRFEGKSWLANAKIKALLSSTSFLQFGYSLFFG